MRIAANIAGGFLGFAFVALSSIYFFNLMPPPEPQPGPVGSFMDAFLPTGYMTFVKIFEVLGGILVAIPKTRNLGLLILGPILLNILAFHILLEHGKDIPVPLILAAIALFLLWVERRSFAALIH